MSRIRWSRSSTSQASGSLPLLCPVFWYRPYFWKTTLPAFNTRKFWSAIVQNKAISVYDKDMSKRSLYQSKPLPRTSAIIATPYLPVVHSKTFAKTSLSALLCHIHISQKGFLRNASFVHVFDARLPRRISSVHAPSNRDRQEPSEAVIA